MADNTDSRPNSLPFTKAATDPLPAKESFPVTDLFADFEFCSPPLAEV